MLSENLRSLRDRFYKSTDSGVVIGPRLHKDPGGGDPEGAA